MAVMNVALALGMGGSVEEHMMNPEEAKSVRKPSSKPTAKSAECQKPMQGTGTGARELYAEMQMAYKACIAGKK
ncbi:MAG: hypothetical protein COX62_08565 [Deltaproteobacteria bacterium CG_4_10_14_0_2_um_filter_43_8]|nr:MAG: hypothetical protein COV43_01320 [Deltaproteobacteria bacterium CG11_big_fil_rev_8_21_14_0_20_42_23]PJA18527.1 MAG: hypothetical protein COX62_08565 [Deltaproteobacteria bacterium CG_4_10_14_0_2_um_filter_43_8]PJC63306.1 MAG: hypothetical protein CO021_10145 [Deltaproteobacteria bacterium CG_4_9_14_0_2_um_filter_42_21]